MFAGWHLCPAQPPVPQPSAVTPLLHLGLLESWLKQKASVLYNPPAPTCSAVRSWRIFSQALLYHLVGNRISPVKMSTEHSGISGVMLSKPFAAHSHWGHPSNAKGQGSPRNGFFPESQQHPGLGARKTCWEKLSPPLLTISSAITDCPSLFSSQYPRKRASKFASPQCLAMQHPHTHTK